ncbi:Ff.00g042230.m01.CDS01 [Fusarium sp. VM40]|nr:Ff.00g042230.m01.CDS01 [Fusarium sp. VM40]
MSLFSLQCCGQKRKQAIEEPAQQADPQATTEVINLEHIRASPQRRSTDIGSDIDDTALAPANGFLAGNFHLPTYRPNNEVPQFFSPANWVLLTISDVLSTMRKDSHLARCVLFETARLQRSLFSVGLVKLSLDARAVDMQLIELDKVLRKGDELIQGDWGEESREKQDRILKGERFQKALRTAKKSLLELEKGFNDQILGELKNGMQSKEIIDWDQMVGKVRNLSNEIRQVYNKVQSIYRQEQEKARALVNI